MINHLHWYRFAALAIGIVLAVGVSASPAGGQVTDQQVAQIESLKAMIAEQEKLIANRDTLIAAQESLLNDYRCMFDIDTQLVPNGCPEKAQPTQTSTATPTPAPTPTQTPEDPADDPPVPSGTTEDQWEQLRQCNSNGNYQHSNPNGVNFGAYEFRQSSWDDLARRHYPHLVGMNPSEAASADQDRMAYALYEERGWAPWPACDPSLPPDDTAGDSTDFPAIPAGTTEAQWDQLRQCESKGNYRAYNPAGPYLGAFQFLQSTWDSVARRNYARLVGVAPRDAAPADQHRMAHALYEESGWRPWPACTAAFRQ